MENTLETSLKLKQNRTFSHLNPRQFTQEDRDAINAKREAQQKWAEEHLKLDWMDEVWMRELAHETGLKLAAWFYPASTTKYIRRALQSVSKDSLWHKEVFGFNINSWGKTNPNVPAWVAQCLVIEQAMLEKQTQ